MANPISKARMVMIKAINAVPGEDFLIPCEEKDRESLRVTIFQERKRLEDVDPDIGNKIKISRHDLGVLVSRVNDMPDEVICFKDGKMIGTEKLIPAPNELILERIQAMLESGLTMEYVTNNYKNHFAPELYTNKEIERAIDYIKQEAAKLLRKGE
jgi:hypothetical protein